MTTELWLICFLSFITLWNWSQVFAWHRVMHKFDIDDLWFSAMHIVFWWVLWNVLLFDNYNILTRLTN